MFELSPAGGNWTFTLLYELDWIVAVGPRPISSMDGAGDSLWHDVVLTARTVRARFLS